jgi:FkbM family methyltransferase
MSERTLRYARLRARAKRRIARATARQVDCSRLLDDLRRRACIAEATCVWLGQGGEESGRPRPELRAQNGEDVLLWGVFGGMPRGFYIEAGAFDGYTFSVSYLFECVGWTGLLVEPLPDHAAACASRRPRSRTVQVALSSEMREREAPFTRISSDELLSYLTVTETHRERLRREQDVQAESVAVPVSTLDEILGGHADAIDFVSLDVEGGEFDGIRVRS